MTRPHAPWPRPDELGKNGSKRAFFFGEEDCLYLDVYSPTNATAGSLPVLQACNQNHHLRSVCLFYPPIIKCVAPLSCALSRQWIFGGAFMLGSGWEVRREREKKCRSASLREGAPRAGATLGEGAPRAEAMQQMADRSVDARTASTLLPPSLLPLLRLIAPPLVSRARQADIYNGAALAAAANVVVVTPNYRVASLGFLGLREVCACVCVCVVHRLCANRACGVAFLSTTPFSGCARVEITSALK